jgi:uncharacterized protein
MSGERLPVHIDPIRMADTRRLLQGEVALAEMPRLVDALQDGDGNVSVSLEFGIDEEGIRVMRGRVQAEVTLVCQRCLEAMRHQVDNQFALGLVRSETEAEELPSHYEPLLLDGKPLFLRDVIEDEMLLALPIVPRHPPQECGAKMESGKAETEQDGGQRDNPFASLAELKTDRKH